MRIALALALLLAGGCAGPQRDAGDVVVFAAASLAAPLDVLRDSFAAAHPGVTIHLNTASSATLARQIEAGAPFDLFFSADPAWVDDLRARGLVDDSVWRGVGNRLTVVRSPYAVLSAITDARRIVTGDPASVPLGQYARQALTCEDVWDEVRDRLVGVVDAGAAAEAVRTGAADGGVLYETDAHRAGLIRLPDIGTPCQPDIRYAGAAAPAASPSATRFFDYVRRAAPVWQAFGFRVFTDG